MMSAQHNHQPPVVYYINNTRHNNIVNNAIGATIPVATHIPTTNDQTTQAQAHQQTWTAHIQENDIRSAVIHNDSLACNKTTTPNQEAIPNEIVTPSQHSHSA